MDEGFLVKNQPRLNAAGLVFVRYAKVYMIYFKVKDISDGVRGVRGYSKVTLTLRPKP